MNAKKGEIKKADTKTHSLPELAEYQNSILHRTRLKNRLTTFVAETGYYRSKAEIEAASYFLHNFELIDLQIEKMTELLQGLLQEQKTMTSHALVFIGKMDTKYHDAIQEVEEKVPEYENELDSIKLT